MRDKAYKIMPCPCIYLAPSFPLAFMHKLMHAHLQKHPKIPCYFSFWQWISKLLPLARTLIPCSCNSHLLRTGLWVCASACRETVGNRQHLFLNRIPLTCCRYFIPHWHRCITCHCAFSWAMQYKYLQGTNLIAFVVPDEDNYALHTLSLPAPFLPLTLIYDVTN